MHKEMSLSPYLMYLLRHAGIEISTDNKSGSTIDLTNEDKIEISQDVSPDIDVSKQLINNSQNAQANTSESSVEVNTISRNDLGPFPMQISPIDSLTEISNNGLPSSLNGPRTRNEINMNKNSQQPSNKYPVTYSTFFAQHFPTTRMIAGHTRSIFAQVD